MMGTRTNCFEKIIAGKPLRFGRWKRRFAIFSIACLVPVSVVATFWDKLPFEIRVSISTAIGSPSYHLSSGTSHDVQVHDWRSFEDWVRANVSCEANFVLQVQDRRFLKKVKSLGVNLETSAESGPQDETWALPRPITVFGFPGERIHYQADSGSEFEIYVNAELHDVANAIHAGRIPLHYGSTPYSRALLKAKPSGGNPFPPLIYLRRGDDAKTTAIGCRYFDY